MKQKINYLFLQGEFTIWATKPTQKKWNLLITNGITFKVHQSPQFLIIFNKAIRPPETNNPSKLICIILNQ